MQVDFDTLISKAKSLRDTVLLPSAALVDRAGDLPADGLKQLSKHGYLGLLIPRDMGGYELNLRQYARCVGILAEGCLSTAFILVMHCHMTAVLRDFASPALRQRVLRDVVRNNALIASVTSEYGRGANLFQATTPLRCDGEKIIVERRSPIVSYGELAEYFIITMRTSEEASTNSVQLALLHRGDGQILVTGEWRGIGMRGTRSVPMEFCATIGSDQLIVGSFNEIAWKTIIPWAYVGWAACWYGAALGAYERVVRGIRTGAIHRGDEGLATLTPFVGRARLLLQALETLIDGTISSLEKRASQSGDGSDRSQQIILNNLKIAASEWAPEIVECLNRICGIASYMQEDQFGLERTTRDLRSAPFMYSNDGLLRANGTLALIEADR